MDDITKDNWKEADLNVDSLWIIGERDKSGKHANVYHGNFIPQIPDQLIRRYTKENDTVMELFSGGGTTLFECERLRRNYIGFDINKQIIAYVKDKMQSCTQIKYAVCDCDVTDVIEFNTSAVKVCQDQGIEKVDFLIFHKVYFLISLATKNPSVLCRCGKSVIYPSFASILPTVNGTSSNSGCRERKSSTLSSFSSRISVQVE